MTPEEADRAEERLKHYRLAVALAGRIEEAIRRIGPSGDVEAIRLPLRPDVGELCFTLDVAKPTWQRICWQNDLPGIQEEVLQAMIAILQRRLVQAIVDRDNA